MDVAANPTSQDWDLVESFRGKMPRLLLLTFSMTTISQNKKFKLIVPLHDEPTPQANQIHLNYLNANASHPHIDEIHILSPRKPPLPNPYHQNQIAFHQTDTHPTYEQTIQYANRTFLNRTKIIIAHPDIYFNTTLEKLIPLHLKNKLLVLTSWQSQEHQPEPQLLYDEKGFPNYLAADAWIFEVPLPINFRCNYKVGCWRTDSFLNRQLIQSGCPTYNPCLDIQCIRTNLPNQPPENHRPKNQQQQHIWLQEFRQNGYTNPIAGIPWCRSQDIDQLPPKFHEPKSSHIVLHITNPQLNTWEQLLIVFAAFILHKKLDKNLWIVEDNLATEIKTYFNQNNFPRTSILKLHNINRHHINQHPLLSETFTPDNFHREVSNNQEIYQNYIHQNIYIQARTVFSHEWVLESDLQTKIHQYQTWLSYQNQISSATNQLAALRTITNLPNYQFLVCTAWQAYQNKNPTQMQNCLQKSLDCSPYSPFETVSNWMEQWHRLASKQGVEFQTTTIQKIPQWQKAVETTLSYNPQNTQNWTPLVSIITSVFQGDKYIQHFLEDITRQTIFHQCELILVNANSPGNEESIIQKYLSKYPNIIYKKLNFDPGLYEVWNLAIRIARGKYLTNANLDDRRAPHHIEKHVRTLENHPEIDLVCAPLKVTLHPNQTWEQHSVAATWFVGLPEYFGRQDLFERAEKTNAIKSRNMPHCMPVWRKQLHWENGFFNETDYGSCADWEFWLRCASQGAQYFLLREPLGIFYRNPKSYNRQHVEKDKIATQKIITKYCDWVDNPHPDTTPDLKKTTSPQTNFVPSKLSAALPKFNLNFAWQDLQNTSSNDNNGSGWQYIVTCLHALHSDSGILIDPCIENRFLPAAQPSHTDNQPQPHTEPWVGFARYPANLPPWFLSGKTPSEMFATPAWKQSLPFCKGIFCFSQHHQQWLSKQLDVPVSNLLHPVEFPSQTFSIEKFTANPNQKVIQVGWQEHKLHSIYYLPLSRFKKAILTGNHPPINHLFEIEKKKLALNPNLNAVETIESISTEHYNNLLDRNIIYIELYDSAANPIVLECIARNTPVLVNPLPSVKEYLGEDYPFYFESKEEAAKKAENVRLIEKTYHYLASLPIKEKLTADYFLQSILNSDVFRSI